MKAVRIGSSRRDMYLTAQHVRSPDLREDVQVFLHRHDAAHPFPNHAPLSVAQRHPGLLVAKSPQSFPAGGNVVLAYLDIIGPDALFTMQPPWTSSAVQPWWSGTIASLDELMNASPLPWVVETGGIHVVFDAAPTIASATEYALLAARALELWRQFENGGDAAHA